MAAEVNVYHNLGLTVDGQPIDTMAILANPVHGGPVAVDDGRFTFVRIIELQPSEKRNIWEWAQTKGFSYVEIRPWAPPGEVAEGFVQIGLRYNPATSADDLTPVAGTDHWKEISKSCVGVWATDTERAYLHNTPLNEVQESGSGTYPGVWDEAGRFLAVCDAISLNNENDQDPVSFVLIVVSK